MHNIWKQDRDIGLWSSPQGLTSVQIRQTTRFRISERILLAGTVSRSRQRVNSVDFKCYGRAGPHLEFLQCPDAFFDGKNVRH